MGRPPPRDSTPCPRHRFGLSSLRPGEWAPVGAWLASGTGRGSRQLGEPSAGGWDCFRLGGGRRPAGASGTGWGCRQLGEPSAGGWDCCRLGGRRPGVSGRPSGGRGASLPANPLFLRRGAPRLWDRMGLRLGGRGASLPAIPCSFVARHHVSRVGWADRRVDVVLRSLMCYPSIGQ